MWIRTGISIKKDQAEGRILERNQNFLMIKVSNLKDIKTLNHLLWRFIEMYNSL